MRAVSMHLKMTSARQAVYQLEIMMRKQGLEKGIALSLEILHLYNETGTSAASLPHMPGAVI